MPETSASIKGRMSHHCSVFVFVRLGRRNKQPSRLMSGRFFFCMTRKWLRLNFRYQALTRFDR